MYSGLGPTGQWGLLPVSVSGLIFPKHLLNPLSYRAQDNETGMRNPSMHAHTHIHTHARTHTHTHTADRLLVFWYPTSLITWVVSTLPCTRSGHPSPHVDINPNQSSHCIYTHCLCMSSLSHHHTQSSTCCTTVILTFQEKFSHIFTIKERCLLLQQFPYV